MLQRSPRFAGLFLDGSLRHDRPSRPDGLELGAYSSTRKRVPKRLRPDRDQIRARTQQVVGVTAALYPTHTHDGDPATRPHLGDLGERHGAHGRS